MHGSEAWYVGLDCGHGFLTGAIGVEMPAPVVGDSEMCFQCHRVRRIVESEAVADDWSPFVKCVNAGSGSRKSYRQTPR